jgi:hypothetical protein
VRWVEALATVSLACASPLLTSSAPPPSDPPRRPPAGEGVVCAWGVYTLAATVGEKCFPGQNPALQADLKAAVSALDAYVARNDPKMTPAAVAQFKREQAHVDAPPDLLCRGDALQMYRAVEKVDRAKWKGDLDRLLARDGKPTWGDCF